MRAVMIAEAAVPHAAPRRRRLSRAPCAV